MADPTPVEVFRVRRLAVGDSTDVDTLNDTDIKALWNEEGGGSVYLTAAEACEMLAARAAKHFTWTADGQTVDMTVRRDAYRERAASLRRRAYGSGSIVLGRHEDIGDSDTEYAAG